jgi:hypothetical protein
MSQRNPVDVTRALSPWVSLRTALSTADRNLPALKQIRTTLPLAYQHQRNGR